MARVKGSTERFNVLCVAGVWEESRKETTRAGYIQHRDATARVSVRVERVQSRDRDGKKLETTFQTITGESGAVASYVATFPPVPSLRVSSFRDGSGMLLISTY